MSLGLIYKRQDQVHTGGGPCPGPGHARRLPLPHAQMLRPRKVWPSEGSADRRDGGRGRVEVHSRGSQRKGGREAEGSVIFPVQRSYTHATYTGPPPPPPKTPPRTRCPRRRPKACALRGGTRSRLNLIKGGACTPGGSPGCCGAPCGGWAHLSSLGFGPTWPLPTAKPGVLKTFCDTWRYRSEAPSPLGSG